MQVTITAVGPDNSGLADPIVHSVAQAGANIHEIQMYDRDSERLFAMLMRIEWSNVNESIVVLRERMAEIGRQKRSLDSCLVARGTPASPANRNLYGHIDQNRR